MAVSEDLLARAKAGLWINTENTAIEQEITDLIEACKLDLSLAGVNVIEDDDPLIIRAVIMYCKAFFGNSDRMEEYKNSYDLLKMSLSLAGDYNEKKTVQIDAEIGAKVIVNGAIFVNQDGSGTVIHKSHAKMYITELLDELEYRYYIGLSTVKDGETEGWAIPDICRRIE